MKTFMILASPPSSPLSLAHPRTDPIDCVICPCFSSSRLVFVFTYGDHLFVVVVYIYLSGHAAQVSLLICMYVVCAQSRDTRPELLCVQSYKAHVGSS